MEVTISILVGGRSQFHARKDRIPSEGPVFWKRLGYAYRVIHLVIDLCWVDSHFRWAAL